MSRITLVSMTLTNFKGTRSFHTEFGNKTEFRGENGTGKTTLLDAFSWVLYGKDSSGRADTNFQVKTLDEAGNPIPRLPHEVEVVLMKDDELITLRKSYTEKWTKKRGCVEEVFDGHVIERFWNNVPMGERDFNSRIAQDICPEDIFKLITNPMHFLTQKPQLQRQFLINLAGDVTTEDIIASNKELQPLAEPFRTKTVEEYTKEISAELKRVKVEKEGIPARIDERKRDVPEAEDWVQIEADIKAVRASMTEIDAALADRSKAASEATERRLIQQRVVSNLKLQMAERRQNITERVQKEFWEERREQQDLEERHRKVRDMIARKSKERDQLSDMCIQLNSTLNQLRAEYSQIMATRFEIDESKLVCPTCKREFEESKRLELTMEMERNFNDEKARRQSDNMQQGQAAKRKLNEAQEAIETLGKEIETLEKDAESISKEFKELGEAPRADEAIGGDGVMASLLQRLEAAEEALKGISDDADDDNTETLKEERKELTDRLQNLAERLSKRDIISRNHKRIMELEEQYKDICAEEVRLTGILELIALYRKTVIGKVEGSINGMFRYIKFRLYETQINGGEKEVCEALIDGVPYSTNVNSAGRVNAGMDFIRAVQEKYDIYAPVFIDNKETVTRLLPLDCQTIELVKDENYKTLTRTI